MKSISFQDYLDAKFTVDEHALNREVFAMFIESLKRTTAPKVLDLGSGTGATFRRFAPILDDFEYTGVDADPRNNESALITAVELLKASDYRAAAAPGDPAPAIWTRRGANGTSTITVEIRTADLLEYLPTIAAGDRKFDAVVAHAVLDILPLDIAVSLVASVLPQAGVFYSTINYDGVTSVFPAFDSDRFETTLLDAYNLSMDTRTANGEPTGGSRTGSAVYHAFEKNGFDVIGFGPSDWSVFPWNGTYNEKADIFLRSIVDMIHAEGRMSEMVDKKELTVWYDVRNAQIDSCALGLVVHQTDIIGERR